jgi:formylglycine-generating enzyme required for sulfatase activity
MRRLLGIFGAGAPALFLIAAAAMLIAAPASAQQGAKQFRDCAGCPRMVALPGGTFQMGAIPAASERPSSAPVVLDHNGTAIGSDRSNALPVHTVTLGPFAIGKYEVTRGQYAAFVRASGRPAGGDCEIINSAEVQEKQASATWINPGFAQTGREPVTCVSWEDAKAYVAWLSKKTGKAYRLASESEWEYAERAGSQTKYWWGASEADGCLYANGADQSARRKYATWTRASSCNDGHAFTAPVGSYRPNAFGLYDMAGNVWEWVEDCYADTFDPQPRNGAAYMPDNCKERVNRGGGWYNGQTALRSASRDNTEPGGRANKVGFRVARDEKPK